MMFYEKRVKSSQYGNRMRGNLSGGGGVVNGQYCVCDIVILETVERSSSLPADE